MFEGRIVNLKFSVAGLKFDAAIDCDWKLHLYSEDLETRSKVVPIELYCFDRPDWDIKMCYQNKSNNQSGGLKHSEVDLDPIIEETKAWIEEMTEKVIVKREDGREEINYLF